MKNILLLGDIVVDNLLLGDIFKISPEGPFPIININENNYTLGCLGNILENIVFFYDNIYLITCINNETLLPFINLIKKYKNVKHKNFNQKNRKLIIKNRIYSRNQYVCRFDYEKINNISNENENNILKYINFIISNINIVILSDYLKGFLTENICKNIINKCNSLNIPTFVDPKGVNYFKYKNCTLIKPNKNEADQFYGNNINKKNIKNFSSSILNKLNIKYILNTLGKKGMRFIYKNNNDIKIINKNIIPSNVVDVIGCGDSIIAALSIYYIKYKNFNNVNLLLNILTKIGNIAVNTSNCYKLNKKDWEFVLKKENNKIVFTNGCFDLIHIGHLKFLKECKKHGSQLIIGINSDDSIKRLKGNTRPINCLKDRILFLKELEIADEIIPFDEDTPLELIKKTQPDILVKGGDYNLENIVGHNIVSEVKIIPFVESYSSTNIIEKIVKKYI